MFTLIINTFLEKKNNLPSRHRGSAITSRTKSPPTPSSPPSTAFKRLFLMDALYSPCCSRPPPARWDTATAVAGENLLGNSKAPPNQNDSTCVLNGAQTLVSLAAWRCVSRGAREKRLAFKRGPSKAAGWCFDALRGIRCGRWRRRLLRLSLFVAPIKLFSGTSAVSSLIFSSALHLFLCHFDDLSSWTGAKRPGRRYRQPAPTLKTAPGSL